MKKEKAPICSLRLMITDEQTDYWLSRNFRSISFENKTYIKMIFFKV